MLRWRGWQHACRHCPFAAIPTTCRRRIVFGVLLLPTQGLPYLYFIFLVVLLSDRARRDDQRCRSKYGTYWDEYCRRVPFKMIPSIY